MFLTYTTNVHTWRGRIRRQSGVSSGEKNIKISNFNLKNRHMIAVKSFFKEFLSAMKSISSVVSIP
jgi:hypothetical protein